jgi:hypothetical protein
MASEASGNHKLWTETVSCRHVYTVGKVARLHGDAVVDHGSGRSVDTKVEAPREMPVRLGKGCD